MANDLVFTENGSRELSLSQAEIIEFLFYRGEYISYFPMASRENNNFKGYDNYLCSNGDCDYIEELPFNKDIYICPNGMKTHFKRSSDNLINIQNFVIDIDAHGSETEEIIEHINRIKEKVLEQEIKPNFINITGRGLHLWYCIEPCHVSLKKTCLNAINMLCRLLDNVLKETKEQLLTVDYGASQKLSGLFRFPYSYNTKSKTWALGELIHKETPNVNDLIKRINDIGYERKPIELKEQKKRKINKFKMNEETKKYLPCLMHRKKFLEHIIKTRGMAKDTTRDLVMFALYATVVRLYKKVDAESYCLNINNRFIDPLTYGEMTNIFKEVNKRKHIFKSDNLFKFIQATDKEIEWYNKETKKNKQKRERKEKKELKYNHVLELYNNGMTVTEISRLINISRPTIYKIIKK